MGMHLDASAFATRLAELGWGVDLREGLGRAAAAADLADVEQDAIAARWLEGMGKAEVARRLGLGEADVRRATRAASIKLLRWLAREPQPTKLAKGAASRHQAATLA